MRQRVFSLKPLYFLFLYLILPLFLPKWKVAVKANLTQHHDTVSGFREKEGRGCHAGGFGGLGVAIQ